MLLQMGPLLHLGPIITLVPSTTLSLFKDPVAPSLHQALEFYIVLVFVLASGKDLYLGLGKHGYFLHSVTCDECWMS